MSKVNIDFDVTANIKVRIKENVIKAIKEYEKEPKCSTKFGDPIIGYVNAKHPMFWELFQRDMCAHPKGIYRPGNTVIIHFVPFSREVTMSNKGGDWPSEQWTKAFFDSMHLSLYLNRVISDTLDEVGRLHSGTSVPTDWNEENYQEEWSHKLAAFIAGMGRFGIAGSFHTEMGFAGRLGSVLVDAEYEILEEEIIAELDIDQTISHILSDSKYLGAEEVHVSEKAIKACPGKAISKDGIDRKKCQEYCKRINEFIPSQEVCGKCFFYDV